MLARSSISVGRTRLVSPGASRVAGRTLQRRTVATVEGNPPATGSPPPLLPPPPPPPRRSAFSSFLIRLTLGVGLLYGGATAAALNNQRFADFYVEKVPLGDKLYDLLEDSSFTRTVRSQNLVDGASRGVEVASAGYHRLTDAVQRVVDDARDKAGEAQEKAEELYDSQDVKKVRKQAKDMVHKVERKVEDADLKEKGQHALEVAETKSKELLQRAKDAARKAERKAKGKVDDAEAKLAAYGQPLPLQHEAPAGYAGSAFRDRGVRADAGEPEARLRDPPALPKLPKLAPSLSSLSAGEPMIAQLASTIDDLAQFLREAPAQAGIRATGVLDEAKVELSKLYERLETVKKNEADKLQRGLDQQKDRYDTALKKAAEEAERKVGKVDAAWKKQQEELRKSEAAEYASKLKTELDTQQEIINERLREEVVQQGIEMQRRWMKEVKARVEAERGGRLARLDQLAKDLDHIQKVSLDNSQALEESATALALSAALRELASTALNETDDANVKQPFDKQMNRVKGALKTALGDDNVLQLALQQLEAAHPEQGVETFSTLYAWFSQKVRPAVQRVALVPEQAGVLSHLMSATVAPLLFQKSGNPQEGDDVPSVLARTQFHLERRDLDSAARELNQLKGWPKILAEDWLNAARRRLEVAQHLDIANAEAHYASLQNA